MIWFFNRLVRERIFPLAGYFGRLMSFSASVFTQAVDVWVCWRLVRGLFYPVSGWFGHVGGLSEGVLSSRWVFWALNVREALFSSTVWMFWAS